MGGRARENGQYLSGCRRGSGGIFRIITNTRIHTLHACTYVHTYTCMHTKRYMHRILAELPTMRKSSVCGDPTGALELSAGGRVTGCARRRSPEVEPEFVAREVVGARGKPAGLGAGGELGEQVRVRDVEVHRDGDPHRRPLRREHLLACLRACCTSCGGMHAVGATPCDATRVMLQRWLKRRVRLMAMQNDHAIRTVPSTGRS